MGSGRALVAYATMFGTTADVAELVARELGELVGEDVAVRDLAYLDLAELRGRELVVLGTPTWNVGQLPPDLESRLPELERLDLRGTCLALFGTGDQAGYPDTFLDAVGLVAARLAGTGARLVGRWPADGYRFATSLALDGGELLGLGVDEDNEPDLTAARVAAWTARVAAEAGLSVGAVSARDRSGSPGGGAEAAANRPHACSTR